MARSTWVAHAFEWEKLLKCHLKGKASKKLANGQNIDYSAKRKRPKGFICPCTGVKYHNIQTCLLVYAADSGERLQDHWSSGCLWCASFKIFGVFMKRALRYKTAKKRLKMAIFKLLVLSYMHTTLYISFFYSNNITKFYVV